MSGTVSHNTWFDSQQPEESMARKLSSRSAWEGGTWKGQSQVNGSDAPRPLVTLRTQNRSFLSPGVWGAQHSPREAEMVWWLLWDHVPSAAGPPRSCALATQF